MEAALATALAVLVVNDGSTDGGPEELAGLAAERLDQPTNLGKGAAILAAAQWAQARGFSHIITLDADGQHDPREVGLFVERIKANPWAIVTGARVMRKGEVPWASRFGRGFSNFWLKMATGVSLPDSQSGLRAYPVAALRALGCRRRHYDFEVEVLVRAAWAGLALEWVGISTRYEPAGQYVSHFRPLLDNLRISRVYACSVLRHFVPWPHRALPAAEGARGGLSLRHPGRLLRTLIRESTTPREIALAAALGVFLGALPLLACHGVVILFVATRLRLNRLIAFNTQHLCTPPLVPALAIELGYFVRHHRFLTELSWRTLGSEAPQRLLDYVLGALIVGPALALIVGVLLYFLARFYQRTIPRGRGKSLG